MDGVVLHLRERQPEASGGGGRRSRVLDAPVVLQVFVLRDDDDEEQIGSAKPKVAAGWSVSSWNGGGRRLESRRGGGRVLTRTNTTIRCGRISNGVSAGCTKERQVEGNKNLRQRLTKMAGNGGTRRRQGGSPTSKFAGMRACRRGLLGETERGGQGLRIGTNGA